MSSFGGIFSSISYISKTCVDVPKQYIQLSVIKAVAPPIDLSHIFFFFLFFLHLSSDVFRGVSWVLLKTAGFSPLRFCSCFTHKKITLKFTQFLLYRYGLDVNQIL